MISIDFSKVGLKMKQLRKEEGITQEKVAEDLECTISFISNVENNRTKLNLRVLLYYANLCHVSVDTFLDAGRDTPLLDNNDNQLYEELMRVFRTFTPEERKKIIKILHVWKNDVS